MRAYDLTVTGSAVISGSVTASYYTGVFNGAVSSSAQIASNISGSFTTVSSSLASRLTSEEADADFIAASISGSWRGELSSSNMTVVGGGVSGSASSTGSFGHVVVGSGTGGSGDKLIKVASQGGGNSSIRLMEGTGYNGFSLLYDGDGNQFSKRGHDNSAGGSQWLMFERDTGAATFAGTLNSGVFTSTGNIVSTGANAKISGSSTSTGSFGALSLDGSPNVYGNEHGIGIGAPAPAHSLDIIDAGNNLSLIHI